MKKERIVVGLSGGVDSSVAAYILKEEGYDVIGITLKVWLGDCSETGEHSCCGPRAVEDARAVAYQLGIPYYVIDHKELFQKSVVDYFAEEYAAGHTPNPCVVCNKKIKFGSLLDFVHQLGASKLATGHYAKVSFENGQYVLRKARDPKKDQSYFLYTLSQEKLSRVMFPLGEMQKMDVREIAKQASLEVFDKEDSVGICFVPDGKYVNFLKATVPEQFKKGVIKNVQGDILGEHDGIQNFTIGQRKGMGFAAGKPKYVVHVDGSTQTVVVGDEEDLLLSECFTHSTHWISPELPQNEFECMVKVRYSHKGALAKVKWMGGGFSKISFLSPERAVTSGQAAVFYDGDRVLGGGFIKLQMGEASFSLKGC